MMEWLELYLTCGWPLVLVVGTMMEWLEPSRRARPMQATLSAQSE